MTESKGDIVFNDLWAIKSSGFMIPLFSIRTNNSLGIGDIGDLYPLIDWAAEHGQKIIQLLPINDTSPSDASPYAAISSFAVNPLYIEISRIDEISKSSSARLLMKEWEADGTIETLKRSKKIDYVAVRAVKMALLADAFSVFWKSDFSKSTKKAENFNKFMKKEKAWLSDYALFHVMKEEFEGKDWRQWRDCHKRRESKSLAEYEEANLERLTFYKWLQWIFIKQWDEMRAYAHNKGVYLMGDISFYPGVDSAEVWAQPSIFQMNEDFELMATSGAPPDQFSADGQNWGTPLYNWDKMEADDFSWWKRRVEKVCNFFDLYRLDHFRGFESFWKVPKGKKASEGEWVKAPGEKLLQRLLKISLYERLIIPLAEDLGDISQEVHELRNSLGIAGYKTFIFGWGEGEDSGKASGFRYPEDYTPAFLATTGTHDTPTLFGWWENLREDEKWALSHYIGLSEPPPFEVLKEAVLKRLLESRANFVVLPFQDIFGLGEEERINFPGTFGDHNWSWKMPFTVEELAMASVETDLYRCGKLLKDETKAAERRWKINGSKEGQFQIIPSAGTVQIRKKGELFKIWLLLGNKPGKIALSSELIENKAIDAIFYEKLPDKAYLYGAEIKAIKKGRFSLNLIIDEQVIYIPDCLIAT
ncbi:MAG: 4-alpha-glucanotransferase [bacterium]|nr:4-alpha-glucanotransferase [bacterium]